MSSKLRGSYFESCSCNVVCLCTASFALGATLDRCRVTLVFNVTSGDVDGTDVGYDANAGFSRSEFSWAA